MITRILFLSVFVIMPLLHLSRRAIPGSYCRRTNKKPSARISILEPLAGTRFREGETVTIKAVADTGSYWL
jgi:hypothetical protein